MAANVDTSKKPSGASSNSPPEDSSGTEAVAESGKGHPGRLVFFIDRSLGRRVIPAALREAGEEVRIHDDYFPQDAKDEVWLAQHCLQRRHSAK